MDRVASGALSSTRGTPPVARGVVRIDYGGRRLTYSRVGSGREQKRLLDPSFLKMSGKGNGVTNSREILVASSAVADATTSPNVHEAK
jgi:hypothetical protein